jgi:glycosyltransferase involved in cell wall biosynthesis
MRVLFFSHQAEFLYGGEIVTLAFMQALQEQGVRVEFASPPGPYQERAAALVKTHTVSSRQFSRKLRLLPGILVSLWKTTRELNRLAEDADVIHVTSLKAMAMAFFCRGNIVWHHHDILPATFLNDLWIRLLGAWASLVIGPSRATCDALKRAGLPKEKCVVLANGFSPKDWQKRPARTSDVFRVALIGEISYRKGLDRLKKIIQTLRTMGVLEVISFSVIGSELSDPEFAARIREELKNEPVNFLGRREDVKHLLQEIDLLLVPSRQDPLPTVIVEAAFSGVPAIGSMAGGIPEMIVNGETGFLAELDEDFADAILEARDRKTWERLSENARRRAEERYDIGKLAAELKGLYQKVRAAE